MATASYVSMQQQRLPQAHHVHDSPRGHVNAEDAAQGGGLIPAELGAADARESGSLLSRQPSSALGLGVASEEGRPPRTRRRWHVGGAAPRRCH